MSTSTALYVDGDSTTTWTIRRDWNWDPVPAIVGICSLVALAAFWVIGELLWGQIRQANEATWSGLILSTLLVLAGSVLTSLPTRSGHVYAMQNGTKYTHLGYLGALGLVGVPTGSGLWTGSDASVWLGISNGGGRVAAARITPTLTVKSDYNTRSGVADYLRFNNPDVEDTLVRGHVIDVRYKNGQVTSYLAVGTRYGTHLLTQDDIDRAHQAAKRRLQ